MYYCENDNVIMQTLMDTYASLNYFNVPVNNYVTTTVQKLYEEFSSTGDNKILKKALLYIKAFACFGFNLNDYEDTFLPILNAMEISSCAILSKRCILPVKPTKCAIRSALSSWKISDYNTKTVTETVNEIFDKLQNNEFGTFIYCYRRHNCIYTHELVIHDQYRYIKNVSQDTYYFFKKM